MYSNSVITGLLIGVISNTCTQFNTGSMDPASLVLSNLHPLVGILRSAYDQYQHICHNREKCLHLIKRSENILVAVDNEIVKYGQPDSLKDAIDRLGQ